MEVRKRTTVDDKYEIIESVGEGSMCTVYRSRHLSLGREVALKLPKPTLLESPKGLERFLQEGRNAQRLDHKHIVTIFDVHAAGADSYLAMEFVDGPTFKSLLHKRCSVERALKLLAQVATALGEAHRVGVVHRDIKPTNILVTKDEQAKVADWGLSKALDDDGNLTKTGRTVGTPRYMSPEQFAGTPQSLLSDLFSLGVVLYETIVTLSKHGNVSAYRALPSAAFEALPPLDTLAPGTPKEIVDLAARLTALDPRARPQSAATVAAELLRCAPLPFTVYADGEVPQRRERRNAPFRQSRLFVLLGVATVCCIFLALLLFIRSLARQQAEVPLSLRSARLVNPTTVAIIYNGPSEGLGTLSLTTPRRLRDRAPTSFDLATASVTSDGSRLEVALTKPLYEPAEALLVLPSFRKSVRLDPRPFLKPILEPLSLLTSEQERSLLKALEDLRLTTLKRAGVGAGEANWRDARKRLDNLFAQVGWSPRTMAPFVAALDAIDSAGMSPSSQLARQLLPLRRIDALLADVPRVSPPWTTIQRRMNITLHLGLVPKNKPGSIIVGFTKTTVPEPCWAMALGRYDETPIFLGDREAIEYVRRAASMRMVQLGDQKDARMLGANDIIATAPIMLPTLEPESIPWPPRKAYIALGLSKMSHAFEVVVSLNGHRPVLFHAAPVDAYPNEPTETADSQGASLSTGRSVATIPISPSLVQRKSNEISLSCRTIPEITPTTVLEVWWAAILVE